MLWTGQIDDARLFGLEGRTGHATFRLLHVLEFRDGKISRENVWADTAAIIAQTQPRLADKPDQNDRPRSGRSLLGLRPRRVA